MTFQVEVISQETIQPSSPTPDHLRHHQLSFLDQIAVPVFMPLVLFYPKQSDVSKPEMCQWVKKSLSESLTIFYPLAGRVKDNSYIDCNDEGVYYVEAQANCQLSDVLQNPNPVDFNKFLPFELDEVNDLAFAVQLTFFQCGGLALSLGMSHKVGDALSFSMFINSWASIARGDSYIITPQFNSSKIFPPVDLSGFQPSTGIVKENIVVKRFVFDASTIAALRAKYAENTSIEFERRCPTRVEALSTFIWSRFMASTQGKTDANKIYTVSHAVNLRTRTDPPLSEHHFGNINRMAIAVASMDDNEDGCYGIVSKMRDAIKKVDADYVKELQKGEGYLNFIKDRAARFIKGEVVSFNFTSLCRFPIYEADFGWGKPAWVGSARLTFKNLVTFFDTKSGGGIEVWINLKEEDMAKFETDKELLACVSPT